MRLRRGVVLAVASALLLLTSLSQAAPGAGLFTIVGPLALPAESRADSQLLAFLDEETESLGALELRAPSAKVRWFEAVFFAPQQGVMVRVSKTERSWTLTDVAVALADGDHAGLLGVYPDVTMTMSFLFLEPEAFERPRVSVISPRETVSTTDGPEFDTYHQVVAQDHLFVRAVGEAHLRGGGWVKISGPDVRVDSAENSTIFETGRFEPVPGQVVYRWLVLEFESATVDVVDSSPLEIAVRDASVAWDGRAGFTPVAGSFRTQGHEYVPSGGREVVEGALTARLVPRGGEAGASDLVDLSGDLRATTLRSVPLPATPALPGLAIGALAFGLALAAVGSIVVARRRPRPRGASALPRGAGWLVYCVDYAAFAESDGDFRVALQCVRAARGLHPRSAELAKWEARLHLVHGNVGEALRAYEAAADLAHSRDGEAHHAAAMLAIRMGATAEALRHLEGAFEREPFLANEVAADAREDDDPFRELRGDGAFERLLAAARERADAVVTPRTGPDA